MYCIRKYIDQFVTDMRDEIYLPIFGEPIRVKKKSTLQPEARDRKKNLINDYYKNTQSQLSLFLNSSICLENESKSKIEKVFLFEFIDLKNNNNN